MQQSSVVVWLRALSCGGTFRGAEVEVKVKKIRMFLLYLYLGCANFN